MRNINKYNTEIKNPDSFHISLDVILEGAHSLTLGDL